MALSLDDKLLGETVHCYCDSSDEEGARDSEDSDGGSVEAGRGPGEAGRGPKVERGCLGKAVRLEAAPGSAGQSCSNNTGPKGVVADFKQFKKLESEKKIADNKEMINLYKSLALSCKTETELSILRKEEEEFRELFESVDGLEEILSEYREKRLEEMREIYLNLPTFNSVTELNALTFVSSIDGENKQINIIIHLYEPHVEACDTVKGCFLCLAEEYPNVKFCNMRASDANMSAKFVKDAVPALVVYRGGELIGNIIQIDKHLGPDFFKEDMEKFLMEFGFIPDKETDSACKLSTFRVKKELSNEDFDID